VELLLDREENRQRIQRVDSGFRERSLRLQKIVGNLFFLAHDGDELLPDLVTAHGRYHSKVIHRVFPWIYVAWIALFAVLFLTLSGLEDPSRPKGLILSNDAGDRALEILRLHNARLRDYEVVHVARARKGEGGARDRWLVLLDRVPHTRLREAVVVELASEDGSLLAIRKPARPTPFN
jgi:hypothetical protein